jgi:TP901 family phage tail tape measure protein
MTDRLATLEIAVIGKISDFVSKMGTADKTIDTFQAKTAALGSSMTKAGASMAILGGAIAAPLGLATREVIKTGSTFEQTMRNVQSVLGETGAQGQKTYETLSQFAQKMGRTTVFQATEAADAMYFLASAGYNAGQQMAALKPILDLAAATQADLASSSEIVVSTLNAFRLPASQAARVANVFSAGISKSQLTMTRLGVAMPYVSAVAKNLNIDLEETVATLGVLVSSGIRAESAGAKLRTTLLRLAKPTKEAQKALAEMGLSAEEVDPSVVGLTEIVDKFSKAGLNAAQASAIFGARGTEVWLTLASQGAERVAELEGAITGTNAAAEMAAIQLDSVSGALKLLRSAIQGIEIIVFEAMRDDLKKLIDVLGTAARALGNFAEKHPTLIRWAVRLGVVLGGMLATVGLLGGSFLILGGQILNTVSHMDDFIRLGKALRTVLTGISVKLMVIIGLLAAFAIGLEIGNYLNQWEQFRTAVQRVLASFALLFDVVTQVQALMGDKQAQQRLKAYWDIASGVDPVSGQPFAATGAVANVSLIDKAVGEIENMFYRAGEAAERATDAINTTGKAVENVGEAAAAIPETAMPGFDLGAGPAPAAPAVPTGRQTMELAQLIAERQRLMGSYKTEEEFLRAIGNAEIELSAAELIRYGQLRKQIAEKEEAIQKEAEAEAEARRRILERRGMEQELFELTMAQRQQLLDAYGSEQEFLQNASLEELERFNTLEERLLGYQEKLQDDTPWTRWVSSAQRASNMAQIGLDAVNNAVNSLSSEVSKGLVKAFDKADNAVISFFGRLLADLAAAIVRALLLKAILDAVGMPGGKAVPSFGQLLAGGLNFQQAGPDFWARFEGGRILDLFSQGIERNARSSPALAAGDLGSEGLTERPWKIEPKVVVEEATPMTKVRVYDEWFADRADELAGLTTESD